MTEEQHRLYDTLIKCLGIIGAIGSFVWGVYQYVDSQGKAIQAEAIARDRAFTDELFKRRLDDYHEIAFAAGKLSAPDANAKKLLSDIQDFERLYWGSVATVESDDVVQSMDYLRRGIENFQAGKTVLGDNSPVDQLKTRSRALSRSIKVAIDQERSSLAMILGNKE